APAPDPLPYTTLFRSGDGRRQQGHRPGEWAEDGQQEDAQDGGGRGRPKGQAGPDQGGQANGREHGAAPKGPHGGSALAPCEGRRSESTRLNSSHQIIS